MTEAEARQDELMDEMVLTTALRYGSSIDPAGDGLTINRIRLAVCDMPTGRF
jgi:hypothetical protein